MIQAREGLKAERSERRFRVGDGRLRPDGTLAVQSDFLVAIPSEAQLTS
jgi:hypothetical protein